MLQVELNEFKPFFYVESIKALCITSEKHILIILHLLNPENDLFNLQPVTVVSDISDQTTAENQTAVFECEIKINYPEITLTWYKGTQKLDKSDKYDISVVGDHHYLKIKNCGAKDQGNYRVVCGPHISNAKLTVSGKNLCSVLCCV